MSTLRTTDAVAIIRWHVQVGAEPAAMPRDPTHPAYSRALIRFEGEVEAWSVFLFLPDGPAPDENSLQSVELVFLARESLDERLRVGREILILTPTQIVARGRITSVLA